MWRNNETGFTVYRLIMTLKNKAIQLDKEDKLSRFQEEFHFPQRNGKKSIYFCGNSLGLQPKKTEKFIANELENWKENGVEGHFSTEKPWVKYHQLSKKSLSKIVGAKENEVVAMNNLTTNLHLGLVSFYRPEGKRNKILIEKGAFPSDFYAVHSQIQVHGLNPSECLVELAPKDGSDYLPTEEITNKINELGDELALVLFPGIQYYTGQFFDLKIITETAHKVGAKVGFDLAHAVGNVPLQLHEHSVDFAVWCTYKYLNSGPGAVGGLFIHENNGENKELVRLSGWWGHDAEARFKMDNIINHIPNVDGWQLSNSNILTHVAHLASLSIFDEAGMENLREKSLKLTEYLDECLTTHQIIKDNINIITPKDSKERGAQLSLYLTNHGKEIFNELIKNGVILDWREPNVIRVAPTPLYNSFSDVYNFSTILADALSKHS